MNGFLIREKLCEQINKKLTREVSPLILKKKNFCRLFDCSSFAHFKFLFAHF